MKSITLCQGPCDGEEVLIHPNAVVLFMNSVDPQKDWVLHTHIYRRVGNRYLYQLTTRIDAKPLITHGGAPIVKHGAELN